MKIKGSSKVVRIFLIVLWVVLFLSAYLFSINYSIKTEKVDKENQTTDLVKRYLSSGQRVLFFFIHPKCSCTLASIDEFKDLLKDEYKDIKIVAIVSTRSSVDNEFMYSESTNLIKELNQVEIFYDIGAIETQKLGIKTSGHLLFYDSLGNLLYSGGITVSRGHRGESVGKMELSRRMKSSNNYQKYMADAYGCGFGSSHWK
jgi:hypothetical protein